MPLLDHFHPPLKGERHWEAFHARWATALADHLNDPGKLPSRYFAETQVHLGGRVEVDVATVEGRSNGPPATAAPAGIGSGAVAVLEAPTYAPPVPALIMPGVFPDEFEVLVFNGEGGPTLVAAIELVSPGNKDRAETRQAFAIKCASYLQRGIGLVVIDVVTDRRANLHDEMIDLLRFPPTLVFPHQSLLYTVAYRPARRKEGDQIDVWTWPLAVGEALPRVPLALRNFGCVEVDLEATYTEARQRSRLA